MGNRGSSSVDEGSCTSCGADYKTSSRTTSEGHLRCSRCGTIVQERSQSHHKNVKKNKNTYQAAGTDEKTDDVAQPIIRLHICPFMETLPDDHQHFTEEQMLDAYIRPYFTQTPIEELPHITPLTRLQISEVDFRVVGSYPPVGKCTRDTIVRCMGKPMHALNHVNRLHVLPTLASLRDRRLDSRALFNDYVKPYFAAGDGEGRHVYQGETFMSNHVQFKVIAADPTDGVVDRNTEIFTDGDPLPDLERVHLLPIYESLPNSEKKISSEATIEKYLIPHFLGRDRVITRNDRLDIDGVEFKVVGVDPDETGVVTLNTRLHAEGEPLRADELKRQQEEDDEAMARRLQQQESGVRPIPFDDIRTRLTALLRVMPENDPHRVYVQRLLQIGNLANPGSALDPRAFMQLIGPPAPQGAPQQAIDSLPTRTYTPLITKKNSPTTLTGDETKEEKEAAEAARAAVTCMVCLSEYEEGEELRTLPCFHSYHRECIDTWLGRSKACPICKNPIAT